MTFDVRLTRSGRAQGANESVPEGLTRRRKPTERGWIPAAGLFATEADGSVQLTDTGQAGIDEAMAKLVPYLPNNPVVVEGYASAGSQAQEYVQLRERALAVCQ